MRVCDDGPPGTIPDFGKPFRAIQVLADPRVLYSTEIQLVLSTLPFADHEIAIIRDI